MPKFIECRHRKLPGRTVLMANPRNGWKPVPKTSRSQAEKDPTGSKPAGSNTTQEQE